MAGTDNLGIDQDYDLEGKIALLSVFDKTGIVDLARFLLGKGADIISSGGTFSTLRKAGLEVAEVCDLTEAPEIFDGRVKTLHPMVHGGILAKRSSLDHRNTMREHGIRDIAMVVVNFYPFAEAVEKLDRGLASDDDCVEMIDIGGPAMVRSAAKNYRDVLVLCDVVDYDQVIGKLSGGGVDLSFRFEMAAKAFAAVKDYDLAISGWFNRERGRGDFGTTLSDLGSSSIGNREVLRYGENPHQAAFLSYGNSELTGKLLGGGGWANFRLVSSKELSYNNILDADAALFLLLDIYRQFNLAGCVNKKAIAAKKATVIVKHTNPMGSGLASSILDAYDKALACDRQSAFGGIVALSDELTDELFEHINKVFVEVILTPKSRVSKLWLDKKPNVRIVEIADYLDTAQFSFASCRSISGGFLHHEKACEPKIFFDEKYLPIAKEADARDVDSDGEPSAVIFRHLSGRVLPEDLFATAVFSWLCVKSMVSNAIAICYDDFLLGYGLGQTSRIAALEQAIGMANCNLADLAGSLANANLVDDGLTIEELKQRCVLSSDAFFPFTDSIDVIADNGYNFIIQPGGALRDNRVVEAVSKRGLSMYFSGRRVFRH